MGLESGTFTAHTLRGLRSDVCSRSPGPVHPLGVELCMHPSFTVLLMLSAHFLSDMVLFCLSLFLCWMFSLPTGRGALGMNDHVGQGSI